MRALGAAPTVGSVKVALFASTDETLLHARLVIRRLERIGVQFVPVTEMTLEEIEPIAHQLGTRRPMIVEAGGAIARWNGTSWDIEPCGPNAETLLEVTREIEDRSGADLVLYGERRFSAPFLIEKGELADVMRAAEELEFTVRRGRRFFYLSRDESIALTRLREEIRCEVVIAAGESPLDAEMLLLSEVPIIVPQSDGQPDPELLAMVPRARIADSPGPAGWAATVHEVLPVQQAMPRRIALRFSARPENHRESVRY